MAAARILTLDCPVVLAAALPVKSLKVEVRLHPVKVTLAAQPQMFCMKHLAAAGLVRLAVQQLAQ